MGIGLSIIEKIARLHGGECTIDVPDDGGFQIQLSVRR